MNLWFRPLYAFIFWCDTYIIKQGEGFGFSLAMAASAAGVGGLGLADVVLYAGSWRRATKEQFETPWTEQTDDKEDLGIKDKYDEELYKFAFDPDSMGQKSSHFMAAQHPEDSLCAKQLFPYFFETCLEAFLFET